MVGAPCVHFLSCAGTQSTGRLKEGKDPNFQLKCFLSSRLLAATVNDQKPRENMTRSQPRPSQRNNISFGFAEEKRRSNTSQSLFKSDDRSHSNDLLPIRISKFTECERLIIYQT